MSRITNRSCQARLQAHGVFKRHCPHARRRCYLNRHPPGLQRLLEEIHLKFLTGAGKLQYQAVRTSG